ncbi:zinc knuckle CX2CX4HX4C containing protein [Tanacetum coccineum]
MKCRVRRLRRNTFISYAVTGSIPINRGLIQAIPTSLPPHPIGEATKASNLQRIPPGEVAEGAALAIPLVAVEEVRNRFVNTLYGYFIGKRIVFPLVEKYVKNTWEKFGLERVMLRNGFFFFQFFKRESMERVIENGLWLIRLVPLIVNIWTLNSMLKKEEISLAPVWVKLHNVPIVAYSEFGLTCALIRGGRNTYTRALIEVSSANALLESLVVAIPLPNGKGHTLETIKIEYEWKPPRCETCKMFDHTEMYYLKRVAVSEDTDNHPKKDITIVTPVAAEEGFTEVKSRKNKGKNQNKSRTIGGVRLNKPQPNFYWSKNEGAGNEDTNDGVQDGKNGSPTPNVRFGNKSASEVVFQVTDVNNNGQVPITKPMEASGSNTEFSPENFVYGDPGESDEDGVYELDDVMARFMSSLGGGQQLKDDDLGFSDGYEAQVCDLPRHIQELCDRFDVRLKRRVRK